MTTTATTLVKCERERERDVTISVGEAELYFGAIPEKFVCRHEGGLWRIIVIPKKRNEDFMLQTRLK